MRLKSINFKINLMVLAVSTFLPALFGFYRYNHYTQMLADRLGKASEVYLNQMGLGLQVPLFNLNDKAISFLLQSALKSEDVWAVFILEKGAPSYGLTRQGETITPSLELPAADHLFFREHKIVYQGYLLGSVRLYMTRRNIAKESRNMLFSLLGQIFLTALTLFAILMILLKKSFINPIEELTKTAIEISSGNLDKTLHFKERKDEIGVLADSFVVMRHAIKTHIDELHKEKAYLEQLFENPAMAVAMVDMDGNVSRVNKTFCRLFEYHADETVGRNIDDLIISPDFRHESISLRDYANGHHSRTRIEGTRSSKKRPAI